MLWSIKTNTELQYVLGRQANLKETSEGKELAELKLQVLEVGKQVMLVNPKKKLWDLKVIYKVRIADRAIRSWIVLWQFQDYHNLVLRQFQEHIFIFVLVPR